MNMNEHSNSMHARHLIKYCNKSIFMFHYLSKEKTMSKNKCKNQAQIMEKSWKQLHKNIAVFTEVTSPVERWEKSSEFHHPVEIPLVWNVLNIYHFQHHLVSGSEKNKQTKNNFGDHSNLIAWRETYNHHCSILMWLIISSYHVDCEPGSRRAQCSV